MHMEEHQAEGGLWIEGCADGRIDIDGVTHHSAVCLNGHAVLPLDKPTAADLDNDDFAAVLAAEPRPEVVLVGTGSRQQFLHPRLGARLAQAGIGLECMSTAAACRTYMILRSEGRRVWAWLWP